MSLSRILLMLMRIGAAVQVVVGLGLWSGRWYSLVDLHRTVGVVYVVLLLVLAIIALVQRRTVKVALFAIVWGFVIAAVGFAQQGILVGDLHWIVRVAHLIIGLAAMPIAERLAPRSIVTAAAQLSAQS
jgi:Gpi18-like mannosyltransferase